MENIRNIKKVAIILMMIAGTAVLFSCGKYSDLNKALDAGVKEFETFSTEMNKAAETSDGKEVAKVIDNHAKKLDKVANNIKTASDKYPEIDLDNPESLPEELADAPEKLGKMQASMFGVFGVLMIYSTDPDVAESMKAFESIDMDM